MIYINDHLEEFDLAAALDKLPEQRRKQALSFRHEHGQRACAAAYMLLCEGLGAEYGITEKPLFEYGEHGKPSIVGRPDIFFNMSHCREAAICVLSNRPVGADIESVSPYKDRLARYTMNEHELRQIACSARPDIAFTRFWTMKEAVLKCTGEGIRSDLKNVLNRPSELATVVSPDERYVYSVCYGAET